jgi:ribonucleoside-diphosphate reductase alpha chain
MPELKEFTKEITVIKRNGTTEPFSKKKLNRVVLWATDQNKVLADQLIEDTFVKIKDRVRTSTIMKNLYMTAANKISLIQPDWQFVAAKLLLQDHYSKLGVKFPKTKYPPVESVFKGAAYSDFVSHYSEDELREINEEIIKPEQDQIFTYAGLFYMLNKYCHGKELPQHTFMRVAMFLFQNEHKDVRLTYVKTLYDALSTFKITMATPVVMNAGKNKAQMASCVLMSAADSTYSITDTIASSSLYSKHHGGISVDVTALRAKGSYISGNGGKSSGPVPFIKVMESVISAWSQGGTRAGAENITFDWWHPDIFDLVALKRNDGTDDTRARHLKYTIRLNKYLFEKVKAAENVKLVDPKKCPELLSAFGDEWIKIYEEAPAEKWVPAADIMYEILKTRIETGNLYFFFTDNVNENNKLGRFINSSNLCCEVLQPSRPAKFKVARTIKDYGTGEDLEILERIPPEISLCTLASVNLHWYYKNKNSAHDVLSTLVRALDNSFDLAFYPVSGAAITAKRWRYIGIGAFNYAYLLASQKAHWESDKAKSITDVVFDSLAFNITAASEELARERGVYPAAQDDPTSKAKTRNALLMAIAPTASSARITGGTESTDPVREWHGRYEATINLPYVVPEFNKYSKWYDKAFDINPETILELGAIRQKYLDQGQSLSLWVTGEYTESAKKLMELHEKALDLGIKTLYYLHTRKSSEEEVCESCS